MRAYARTRQHTPMQVQVLPMSPYTDCKLLSKDRPMITHSLIITHSITVQLRQSWYWAACTTSIHRRAQFYSAWKYVDNIQQHRPIPSRSSHVALHGWMAARHSRDCTYNHYWNFPAIELSSTRWYRGINWQACSPIIRVVDAWV
jgi:hypothetical protein